MNPKTALWLLAFAMLPLRAAASPGDLLSVIENPHPGPYADVSGFGSTLAASGGQLLIGASGTHRIIDGKIASRFTGAAYVFDAATADLVFELPHPDPENEYTQFGIDAAAAGDLWFVTWYSRDGAIQAYDRQTGEPVFGIEYPGTNSGNAFGRALTAFGDDWLVAASPSEIVDGTRNAGALYVLDSSSGEVIRRIPHPDPSTGGPLGQMLGLSVLGDKIIAGASLNDPAGESSTPPGSAYVFDGTTGDYLYRLDNPSPSSSDNPPIYDWFGFSVAATDDKILVSAPLEDSDDVINSGAVHVFDGNTGEFLYTITNPDPQAREDFGRAIAGVGGNILVGAWRHEVNGLGDVGTAYLFDGDTGELLLEIPNPTGQPGAFGFEVASMGNNLVIGAPGAEVDGYYSGAVYVFEGVPEPNGCFLLALIFVLSVRRRCGSRCRNPAWT